MKKFSLSGVLITCAVLLLAFPAFAGLNDPVFSPTALKNSYSIAASNDKDGSIYLSGRIFRPVSSGGLTTRAQGRLETANYLWTLKDGPTPNSPSAFSGMNCAFDFPGPGGNRRAPLKSILGQSVLLDVNGVIYQFDPPVRGGGSSQPRVAPFLPQHSVQSRSLPITGQDNGLYQSALTAYAEGSLVATVKLNGQRLSFASVDIGQFAGQDRKAVRTLPETGKWPGNLNFKQDTYVRATVGKFSADNGSQFKNYLFVTTGGPSDNTAHCLIFNLESGTLLPTSLYLDIPLDFASPHVTPLVTVDLHQAIHLVYLDKTTHFPKIRTLHGVTLLNPQPDLAQGAPRMKLRKVKAIDSTLNRLLKNSVVAASASQPVSFGAERPLAWNGNRSNDRIIDLAVAFRKHIPIQTGEDEVQQNVDLVLFSLQGNTAGPNTRISSTLQPFNTLYYDLVKNPCPKFQGKFWMAANESMHSQPLKDWILPGTHDSGAYFFGRRVADTADAGALKIAGINDKKIPLHGDPFTEDFWITSIEEDVNTYIKDAGLAAIRSLAITQQTDIAQQLEDGIRAFDFRVYFAGDGKAYVHHTLVGVSYEDVFRQVQQFLQETKGEYLLLKFSHFEFAKCFSPPQKMKLMDNFQEQLEKCFDRFAVSRQGTRPLVEMTYQEIVKDPGRPAGSRVALVYDAEEYPPAMLASPLIWTVREYWGRRAPVGYTDTSSPVKMISALQAELDEAFREHRGPMQLWYTLTPQPDECSRIIKTAMLDALPAYHRFNPKVFSNIMGSEKRWQESWKTLFQLVDRLQTQDFVGQFNLINKHRNRFAIIWMDFYQQNPLDIWFKQTPPPASNLQRAAEADTFSRYLVTNRWSLPRLGMNKPVSLAVKLEIQQGARSALIGTQYFWSGPPQSLPAPTQDGQFVFDGMPLVNVEDLPLEDGGETVLCLTPKSSGGSIPPGQVSINQFSFQPVGRCETLAEADGFHTRAFMPAPNATADNRFESIVLTWNQQEWMDGQKKMITVRRSRKKPGADSRE